MLRQRIALTAVFTFAFAALGIGSAPAPFSLHISAARNPIPTGQTVTIIVQLKNTSRETIHTADLFSGQDRGETLFEPYVTQPDGAPAQPSSYSLALKNNIWVDHFAPVIIPPAGSFEVSITLTKLFEMTAAGTYRVQVCADWRKPVSDTRRGFPPLYPKTCSQKLKIVVKRQHYKG
jgi:hypothetical protein